MTVARVLLVAVAIALASLGSEAIADTITFTSPVIQSPGPVIGGEFFVEGNFRVEPWLSFPVWGPGPPRTFNNIGALTGDKLDMVINGTTGSVVSGIVIERVDGGLFDLDSLELSLASPGDRTLAIATAPTSELLASGDWTVFPVTVPVGGITLQTPGFTGVTRVWIGGWNNNSSSVFLDNIKLTPLTPVPEPTTLALLGAGLAGVVASRRRRKSRADG